MIKCKDCKYWERLEQEFPVMGKCEKFEEDNGMIEIVLTEDGGIIDSFTTRQDYGCVLGKK